MTSRYEFLREFGITSATASLVSYLDRGTSSGADKHRGQFDLFDAAISQLDGDLDLPSERPAPKAKHLEPVG